MVSLSGTSSNVKNILIPLICFAAAEILDVQIRVCWPVRGRMIVANNTCFKQLCGLGSPSVLSVLYLNNRIMKKIIDPGHDCAIKRNKI